MRRLKTHAAIVAIFFSSSSHRYFGFLLRERARHMLTAVRGSHSPHRD